MSASTETPDAHMRKMARKWGLFVALGIGLIVLGVIAWLDVIAVTIAGTIFIGAMLLVGGAFQIVHA